MITLENIHISYGSDKKVIRALDLSISEATINGIVGLNGAGKTTLLNAIYGIKKMDEGSISLNGQKLIKKSVSYLVTEPYFYPLITGNEYLQLFKNEDFDIEQWNQLFGLPLDQLIDSYSTGMKKKLAIIGVLKQDKELMILDEPFNGLDIESVRLIRSILLNLKQQNKTIIITSHIIETLTNLCDFIHYLEGGIIKYSKGKEDFDSFEEELFKQIENKNTKLLNTLLKK